MPITSSTMALTGISTLRRSPSITSTVMVSPVLTPSRWANRRVSVMPSGAISIGRSAASCGRRSSLRVRQTDHRGEIGPLARAHPHRHDALALGGEHTRARA